MKDMKRLDVLIETVDKSVGKLMVISSFFSHRRREEKKPWRDER